LSQKIYFDVLEEKFITMLDNSFNLLQFFNYMPYLFYKKRLKSEINSFCIWTQYWADIQKEIPFMTRTITTGSLLIAQIHGYLLGLKSIKTFIVGLQKI